MKKKQNKKKTKQNKTFKSLVDRLRGIKNSLNLLM